MDEELVNALEAVALSCRETGGVTADARLLSRAAAEIRRMDVIIKEGQRQAHNEMYGRSSSGMAIPTR